MYIWALGLKKTARSSPPLPPPSLVKGPPTPPPVGQVVVGVDGEVDFHRIVYMADDVPGGHGGNLLPGGHTGIRSACLLKSRLFWIATGTLPGRRLHGASRRAVFRCARFCDRGDMERAY